MLLLVVIMGISLSCLVRYQNIQITELEKQIEIQDYAITALADEVGEAWHQIDNMGGDLYDRVRDLEDKHRLEIVNIEDGRIDVIWRELFDHSPDYSRIDWLEEQIFLHSHSDVWLEIEAIKQSPCNDGVIENTITESIEDCCFKESLQFGLPTRITFYTDCVQYEESSCRRDKIITPD